MISRFAGCSFISVLWRALKRALFHEFPLAVRRQAYRYAEKTVVNHYRHSSDYRTAECEQSMADSSRWRHGSYGDAGYLVPGACSGYTEASLYGSTENYTLQRSRRDVENRTKAVERETVRRVHFELVVAVGDFVVISWHIHIERLRGKQRISDPFTHAPLYLFL